MTVTQPTGALAPPFGGYTRAGYFYPKNLANTPGYACGTVPITFFQLFRYGQSPGPYTYQARVAFQFLGFGTAGLNPGDPTPLTHLLQVYYKTPVFNTPLFCLNWFYLDWETAQGSLERQNPDGEGWESYGIGPGNNRSYQFHRGDFPEIISIRPWGT